MDATRPTSPEPPIRITLLPVSQPTARCATRPAPGRPSSFNHASVFPLTGAHATLACAQCHTNNNYTTLPTTCFGCHQTDWNGTTNPSHIAAGFPTTCDTCHTTTNWTNVNFNHAVVCQLSADRSARDADLHPVPHQQQLHEHADCLLLVPSGGLHGYDQPEPRVLGIPDRLLDLPHDEWLEPVLVQSQQHRISAYRRPYNSGLYAVPHQQQLHDLPTTCYGCHQTDWNGTTNPNHAAAGFPTTCDTCHTTTAWTGATFNHNNTPFPLTGAHVNVDCNQCHINNVFAGTPTALLLLPQGGLHRHDKSQSRDCGLAHHLHHLPHHNCWLPATLPASYHTFFPLNHGNANGVCATCHTNSSDYSVFPAPAATLRRRPIRSTAASPAMCTTA